MGIQQYPPPNTSPQNGIIYVPSAAARTALSGVAAGQMVYQADTGEEWLYHGGLWRRLGKPHSRDGAGLYYPNIWSTPLHATQRSGQYLVKDGYVFAEGFSLATGAETGTGGVKRTTVPQDASGYLTPSFTSGVIMGEGHYFKQGVGLYHIYATYDTAFPNEPIINNWASLTQVAQASSTSDYLFIRLAYPLGGA